MYCTIFLYNIDLCINALLGYHFKLVTIFVLSEKFIYDEVDIEAYKNKKGQRVSWSSYEDSLVRG